MKRFLIIASFFFALLSSQTLVSCEGENNYPEDSFKIAEAQLYKDYADYSISKLSWNSNGEYSIASFSFVSKDGVTKSNEGTSATVWYSVENNSARRIKDSKHLIELPDIIKPAFNSTVYSNSSLWRIDEIELDEDFLGYSYKIVYEVELQSLTNDKLEAELIFDANTGALLFSKEELDRDDDRDDFIVNESLREAVASIYPTAVILEAELEDGMIEVEAILDNQGVKTELTLYFSMEYKFISEEKEEQYTYGTMPENYLSIKQWYSSNSRFPEPPAATIVKIESEQERGVLVYEVELDDYFVNGIKYEAEFILNKDYKIIEAEVEIDD